VRTTIRLRLALAQAGIFAIVAVALVGGIYLLAARSLGPDSTGPRSKAERALGLPAGTLIHDLGRPSSGDLVTSGSRPTRPSLFQIAADVQAQTRAQLLDRVLLFSGILVGVAILVTFVVAWLVARRSLRPLRRITSRARTISASDLREPIALEGPRDELRELADTFDEMLGRLDRTFEGQRLFAANASHELRTPLTLIRTKLDVTLAEPDVSREELDEMARTIRGAVNRSSQLIDALLTLARTSGPLTHQPVALDRMVQDALDDLRDEADRRGLSVQAILAPCTLVGDPVLLDHLVRNVLSNAIVHNLEGGYLEAHTYRDDQAHLIVTNGGAVIPASSVTDLFLPLHRGESDRIQDEARGFGIGLAIVRAVTEAHRGTVIGTALVDGGLTIELTFPSVEVGPAASSKGRFPSPLPA
jgi:signal transduction histidine kinase